MIMTAILITKSIKKELDWIFTSNKSINLLIKKLKSQEICNIYLKRPFVKIKISIFSNVLRLIWEYRKINWILVLILIFKKSDKKYWDNTIWSKDIENLVINKLSKISQEIKENEYNMY